MGILSFLKNKQEKPQPNPMSREAAQKILDAQTTSKKEEKFRLAGVSFYQDEIIEKYGRKNADFLLKAVDFKKKHPDDIVYEYSFSTPSPELLPEPENEHDSNAIAVYAGSVKIGYIKKGSTARIRNIIKSRRIDDMRLVIRSGNSKYYDDVEGRVTTEKSDIRADLIITHSEL